MIEGVYGDGDISIVTFILIFLLSIPVLVYGFMMSNNKIKIIEYGEFAEGTIVNRISKSKICFSFTDKYNKKQEAIINVGWSYFNFQPENAVMLLYLPENIQQALVFEQLPSLIKNKNS